MLQEKKWWWKNDGRNLRKSHRGGIPLPGRTGMQYMLHTQKKQITLYNIHWQNICHKLFVKCVDSGDEWCPIHLISSPPWWPGRGQATQDNSKMFDYEVLLMISTRAEKSLNLNLPWLTGAIIKLMTWLWLDWLLALLKPCTWLGLIVNTQDLFQESTWI